MKIRPVGAELFHAYELIDMVNIIVAVCNFENVPKNGSKSAGFFQKMLSSPISHISALCPTYNSC